MWTVLASQSIGRFYHSSALLLPDGRVLSVGGDDTPAVEIFSPPYLFKGARPSMSAVPATINYGQQFSVQSPDASGIGKVTLIRIANVTHAFDQNQRLNVLQFTQGSGTLSITPPANANLAPPGLYMLFIVNGSGVPSVASLLKLAAGSATVTPPTVTSLSPNSATAGGAAFTLTVNGSNFVSGATVRWNGAARTTTFVSATQVTAAIPASDIAAAGTPQVTAINPGSAASNALTFTVSSPTAPSLTSLSPNSATGGGAAFTLAVNGSNFVSGATVRWNGAARTTTFVSATQVTAAIPASDIAAAGTPQVTAINPGSAASNALTFTVSNPTVTAPSLTSLSPNSATTGGAAFTLTVNGSNFVSGATVELEWRPAHHDLRQRDSSLSGHPGQRHRRSGNAAGDRNQSGERRVERIDVHGIEPDRDGALAHIALAEQRDRRGRGLHAHRQWQQLRLGRDGQVERGGAHHEFRQRDSSDGGHPGQRHRRSGDAAGDHDQSGEQRVERTDVHGVEPASADLHAGGLNDRRRG